MKKLLFLFAFIPCLTQAQYSFKESSQIYPGGFLYDGNSRVYEELLLPKSNHTVITTKGPTLPIIVITLPVNCGRGKEYEDIVLKWVPNGYMPAGWLRIPLPVCGSKIHSLIINGKNIFVTIDETTYFYNPATCRFE